MIFMAKLSKEQAQEILESHGYKIIDYLGEGAASYVFHAMRHRRKDGIEKQVAAKVCCPSSESFASLSNELEAADELKKLKDDFKAKVKQKIAEARKNGNSELAKKLEDEQEMRLKKYFKYLTIPKFKQELRYDDDKRGKTYTVAIFEAPLADSNMRWPGDSLDRERELETGSSEITVIKNANVNYRELKRIMRSVLKGLKTIHSQNMSHGDIHLGNVLRKIDPLKRKYRYSITDFGTLKKYPGGISEWRIKSDLKQASNVFINLWFYCLNGIRGNKAGYEGPRSLGQPIGVLLVGGSMAKYFPTKEDIELSNCCRSLWSGDYESAEEALEKDPWLKKS